MYLQVFPACNTTKLPSSQGKHNLLLRQERLIVKEVAYMSTVYVLNKDGKPYDTNGNTYPSCKCKFVAKNKGIVFAKIGRLPIFARNPTKNNKYPKFYEMFLSILSRHFWYRWIISSLRLRILLSPCFLMIRWFLFMSKSIAAEK